MILADSPASGRQVFAPLTVCDKLSRPPETRFAFDRFMLRLEEKRNSLSR